MELIVEDDSGDSKLVPTALPTFLLALLATITSLGVVF